MADIGALGYESTKRGEMEAGDRRIKDGIEREDDREDVVVALSWPTEMATLI